MKPFLLAFAMFKTCFTCKIEKHVSLFGRHSQRKDGLYPSCKDCRSIISVAHRKTRAEKISEYNKEYRKKNTGYMASYLAEYRKKNPECNRTHHAKRRARIKLGESKNFKRSDVLKMHIAQRCKCAVCKVDISKKYHVDHITALAKGGTNDRYNIQLLCPTCNMQKHTADPIEFMQKKGYLL